MGTRTHRRPRTTNGTPIGDGRAARPTDPPTVPDGWEGIAALAGGIVDDLDGLVEHIVDDVVAEVPAYRDGTVPLDDLRGSVVDNLRAMLRGLAEHRGPTADELAERRGLGTRRALQGMPVDALLQAYHVGYRELWQALVRAVPPDDATTTTQLLTAATTVWQWVHEVSDAIAGAHAAAIRSLEARAVGARQRFVELLVTGDTESPELARLGATLGLDPADRFTVTLVRGASDDLEAVDLQREADHLDGRHAVAHRGPLLVVVSQQADEVALLDAARRVLPSATIAAGVARPGFRGARTSLQDAHDTLAVQAEGTTAGFDETWLWATLAAADDRLADVLVAGVEVAVSHPHLAEAVEAFGTSAFSVTEASRHLAVHANTVAYRLERWAELTGWDPRTFAGLARSMAALRRVGRGGTAEATPEID